MRPMCIGLVVALAAAPAQAQDSFCEQLAREAGMTAERTASGEPPRLWSMRVMKVVQRLLVGGSYSVSAGMVPPDDATGDEYRRLSKVCQPIGKRFTCSIQGPAVFRLVVNGKEARATANAGETAQVEMQGTRITCSTG